MARPSYAADWSLSAGLDATAGAFFPSARSVAVSNDLWAFQLFRPYWTAGWNYCRDPPPAAGKLSFFRDHVVIKYGQEGTAGDVEPGRYAILGE